MNISHKTIKVFYLFHLRIWATLDWGLDNRLLFKSTQKIDRAVADGVPLSVNVIIRFVISL